MGRGTLFASLALALALTMAAPALGIEPVAVEDQHPKLSDEGHQAFASPFAASGGGGGSEQLGQPPSASAVVPEPGTIALLGVGLAAIAARRRRKNRAAH